jgi:hypothetical protein
VSVQANHPVRSWVFIYLGLIASIVMAGQPAGADTLGQVPPPELEPVPESPLLRRDI